MAEGAAALIFNQSNRAKADAQSNLTAIAEAGERDQNRQMALMHASKVEDPELRDSTNADLARQYLFLLDSGTADRAEPIGDDNGSGTADRAESVRDDNG